MAWEVDTDRIDLCSCGKGKKRYVSESNDWNESRTYVYISCKECYEKALEYQSMRNKAPNFVKHDDSNYIYKENI